MKRLTGRRDGRAYIIGCPDFALPKIIWLIIQQTVDRLAAIEDILGDEYELEQIGKVVHCKDCMHMWAEAEFPGECYCRMLGEVVPFDGFCHKGEAALKAREQDEQ